MAFPDTPLDPTNVPSDAVRLIVGDTESDEVLLSTDLYEYFLVENNDDVNQTSVAVLKALVAKFARYAEEKTGEVQIKYQQYYKHYKDMLKRAKNDPINGLLSAPQVYAGGLSKKELETDDDNSDLNQNAFEQDWVSCQFNRGLG